MKLEESTFTLYASKYYDNPQCHSIEEFEDDLKRISYIKKIFIKYKQTGEINERLILNHMVVFFNCFGINGANMLFMKLEKHHDVLKPFIEYLNFLPYSVTYNNKIIYTDAIMSDGKIKDCLSKI